MTKFPEDSGKFRQFQTARNWIFEIEPYSRAEQKTLKDVRGDRRLKVFLKRAVEHDFAPESLKEAIRNGIRR